VKIKSRAGFLRRGAPLALSKHWLPRASGRLAQRRACVNS
jgi:hypothetical protein